MKKYLKQLRQEIMFRSFDSAYKKEDIFDVWDQNHIEFEGSNLEFHNVASTIAQLGYYGRACEVLQEGINQYPNDTDLLADYLAYGKMCNKIDECEKYYNILDSIPDKRKTWRAFDFSIDYLIYKINMCNEEEKIDELKECALKLVQRFKDNLPREELAYLSEYNIYEATFEENIGLEKLEEFLNCENRIAKVAPKCHLCYIDKMLELGEYDKVVLYASDGAAEAAQEQEGVDTGYFFYALALSKDALWLKADESNRNDDIEEAKLILKYYQTAYDTLDSEKIAYFKVIAKRYKIISNISGLNMELNQWRENKDELNPLSFLEKID